MLQMNAISHVPFLLARDFPSLKREPSNQVPWTHLVSNHATCSLSLEQRGSKTAKILPALQELNSAINGLHLQMNVQGHFLKATDHMCKNSFRIP